MHAAYASRLRRAKRASGAAAARASERLCMHRHSLTSFPNGFFGGNLYLFECPHLNLSNALARHFEFYRKVFQRPWFIDEMARLEDAPFAIVEDANGADERFPPVVHFVMFDDDGFRRGTLVDEVILPFPGVSFVADRCVQRCVSAQAPIHVHDFLILHAERCRNHPDLLGAQIGIVESGDLGLGRAKLKEQLFLVRSGTDLHKRPGSQDVVLNRGPDPPDRIGSKAEASLGFEAIYGLHQADVAFGYDLRKRQTIAAVVHRYFGGQTQMAGDDLVRSLAIAVLPPALGEPVLLLSLEERETSNVSQIA